MKPDFKECSLNKLWTTYFYFLKNTYNFKCFEFNLILTENETL